MWTSLESLFCGPETGSKEQGGREIFLAEVETCKAGADSVPVGKQLGNQEGVGTW